MHVISFIIQRLGGRPPTLLQLYNMKDIIYENAATWGIACSCQLETQLGAIKAGWIHFHPMRLDARHRHL